MHAVLKCFHIEYYTLKLYTSYGTSTMKCDDVHYCPRSVRCSNYRRTASYFSVQYWFCTILNDVMQYSNTAPVVGTSSRGIHRTCVQPREKLYTKTPNSRWCRTRQPDNHMFNSHKPTTIKHSPTTTVRKRIVKDEEWKLAEREVVGVKQPIMQWGVCESNIWLCGKAFAAKLCTWQHDVCEKQYQKHVLPMYNM